MGISLGKGWKGSFLSGRARPIRIPEGLSSEDEFHVILRRECARSDRNGHGFSVVAFNVGGESTRSALAERLTSVVFQRLRATDEMGWLDDERIGVFLYNTPREKAWDYAANVRTACAAEGPAPECDVYTYPALSARSREEKKYLRENCRHRQVLGKGSPRWFAGRDYGAAGKGDGIAAWARGGVMGVNVLALDQDTVQSKRARGSDFNSHALTEACLLPFQVCALPPWKRVMDIVGASIALLVLSPVLLAVAIAIRLTSRGPVIFKQKRAGLRGEPFTCCKFRSMVADAEARKEHLLGYNERSGVAFKMANDPRVTPIGRFLRKTSLDELPQLFNVLRGEMSLVGPRPLPIEEAKQQSAWHNMRLEVTPGITCLWQIYARHSKSFDRWAGLDIEYIRRRSPLLDLKLLLLTIPAVISMRGAS